jgi:alpha-N-arabinofuranosidase
VARLAVDPAFVVGALDRRLFGSFVDFVSNSGIKD